MKKPIKDLWIQIKIDPDTKHRIQKAGVKVRRNLSNYMIWAALEMDGRNGAVKAKQ